MKDIYHNFTSTVRYILKSFVEGKVSQDSSLVWRLLAQWGFLSFILIIYFSRALNYLGPTITPDAETTYLPYAQKVLDQGFSFLFTIDSILIAPVTYFWPALFGGEAFSVKCANVISGLFMVMLVYAIGKRCHSHIVGLIAAFLFARSPLLIHWIPTVLSEPPFFLFTLMWIWASCEVIGNRRWAIPIASLSLSLSILTRAAWLYPSIFFLMLALLWLFIKPEDKRIAFDLILTLLLALILPVTVIVKNYILFDFPSIALGSGFAFYLGTNLMTNGFEPYFLGVGYGGGENAKSVLGDKEHFLVAIEFLKDRSITEFSSWFFQKISWALLFSPVDVSFKVSVWRVLELSFVVLGCWWGIKQRSIFVWLFGLALLLQLFQLVFVLYNPRYSAGGLEFLLIPLAAIGIVAFFSSLTGVAITFLNLLVPKPSSNAVFNVFESKKYTYLGCFLIIVLVTLLSFRSAPVLDVPPNIPTTILFEKNYPMFNVNSLLSTKETVDGYNSIVINVPKQILPEYPDYAVWQINMAILGKKLADCSLATIQFNPIKSISNNSIVSFKVNDDGDMHTYNIGTLSAFPFLDGKLNLKVNCSSGINVSKISLIVPHMVKYYWGRIK